MKLSAILLAGALVLAAVTPALANPPGGPPQNHNNCGEYCWMEYITPINANVNVAFVDSDIKTSAFSGDNKVRVVGEIDDLHSSNATLNLGVASVTSGKASAETNSLIYANMIKPVGCNGGCSVNDGIYLNANVAFIDSYLTNRSGSGDNSAKLSSEIEDLCHSNATLNGGMATVNSGEAWSKTGSLIEVNMIGDFSSPE